MTAIKSDVGGNLPAGSQPVVPSATLPRSDTQTALEWLSGQITAAVASLTALIATTAADLTALIMSVRSDIERTRSESRKAQQLARSADAQAALKAQVFN